MLFYNEKRKEILEQNPGIKNNDVAIKLGEQWKNLPEQDKSRYQQMYDEALK